MGKRHVEHPQATLDRLYAESQRPNPWTPQHRYRILLKRRDGRTERRNAPPTLEEARQDVKRYFELDALDLYSHAWIAEEVVV